MNEKTIPLVHDKKYLNSGISAYIPWEYQKFPHLVIFGSTGSGKTYLLKLLLGRIGLYLQNSELVLCDFKGDDDFIFLEKNENFYRFELCSQGLSYAVKTLKGRQSGEIKERHFFMLVFDEWASFLNNLDKKIADSAKNDLASLLMLGRSFNIHVCISQQRLDASYFSSARDNFSVIIGMGVLSKESIEMMFSDYKDIINRQNPQGEGSLLLGSSFHEISVPQLHDFQKLHSCISSITNKSNRSTS